MNFLFQLTSKQVRRHLRPRGNNSILYLDVMCQGHRVRESMHTPDLRDATQRAMAFLDSFVKHPPRQMKLSELLDQYLAIGATDNTKKHTAGITSVFKRFISFTGDKRISEVETSDVKRFQASLVAKVVKVVDGIEKTLSGYRVNNSIMALRAVFTFAVANNWLDENPAAGVKRVKVLKRLPNAFEPEVMRAIIEAARLKPRDYDKVLEIYLFTGVRLGEGLRIKTEDVDLDRKFLTLRAETTKTSSERKIALNSRCVSLMRYMIDKYGRPIPHSHSILEHYFNDLRDEIDFQGKFHDIRKTTNSWLMSYAGLASSLCELVLGHSGSRVNREHYLRAMNGVIPEAMEKLVHVLYPSYHFESGIREGRGWEARDSLVSPTPFDHADKTAICQQDGNVSEVGIHDKN